MNNRNITLQAANEILSIIGVEILKSDLGYYYTHYNEQRLENRTIKGLFQQLLLEISKNK
jgi:hypothetical protein